MSKKEFKASSFFDSIKSILNEKETSIGNDDNFKVDKWYSTGSWMLNMQLNGGYVSMGGVPEGKLTVFAGPESCGKTYFAIQTLKDFLEKNKDDGYAIFFDSENNISKKTFLNAGISEEDVERVAINRVATYEEFRTRSIHSYNKAIEADIKLMVILDSLGALVPQKEIKEAEDEPDKEGVSEVKASVGKSQQIIKQFTKMICKYAPLVHAPVIIVAHVYDSIGAYFPKKEVAGGSGIKYMNSNMVEFFRSKNKEDESDTIHEVSGILVTSHLSKSRFAREETKVKSFIHFNKGVIPHYGFITLFEQAGIINKSGFRYEIEKDKDGNWCGKKYRPKELSNDFDTLLKPKLKELEKWTISNFGLGKISMNIEASDVNINIKDQVLNFENIDEESIHNDEEESTEVE